MPGPIVPQLQAYEIVSTGEAFKKLVVISPCIRCCYNCYMGSEEGLNFNKEGWWLKRKLTSVWVLVRQLCLSWQMLIKSFKRKPNWKNISGRNIDPERALLKELLGGQYR